MEEKSCKRLPINKQLDFDVKSTTCLNASITLSKLPIMMQTQNQATNMR
jgi:hypothetical protein